jgi:hypothetical protein
MSEQQPNNERQPKRYYLEYNGERYILGPGNTLPYMHSDTPGFDHFYVQFNDDEDGEQQGHYEWRETYVRAGNEQEFNEKIINLIEIGCKPKLAKEVSDFDREQFYARFGTNEPTPKQEYKEPELITLTPRQERFAQYFAHILLNNHLTPEEFRNTIGDLHL